MPQATLRRGLALAAAAAAALLAACESGPSKAELEAQRVAVEAAAVAAARVPPPITLNEGVAQAASIYVTFVRDVGTIRGGFESAEAIQAALRKGAAYDPAQLSRGLIAYSSILALQSPEFVAGVRQYAIDPQQRREIIAAITADPTYAATFPGAEEAAGLIIATLGQDIDALVDVADSVENDAYSIQERADPRRAWAVAHIADREVRLQSAKTISGVTMLPSAEESARLFAAAGSGSGLTTARGSRRPPYTPAIANALAIAALAVLGGAGEEARATTEALQTDSASQFCLNISKLNLYQCLAASRPSYEDMFCVGRHIVRDLASCTKGTAIVPAIISVGDPVDTGSRRPVASTTQPRPPAPTVTPVPLSLPAQSTAEVTSSLNARPLTSVD